jgi:hypothetical protein
MSRNSDSGGSTGKQLLHFLRTLFLPRFCDLLCACRYEEALQCLSTYYVDCTLDPRDGCNSNKQFVENLESPFILLVLCEKIFDELSFIGVKDNNPRNESGKMDSNDSNSKQSVDAKEVMIVNKFDVRMSYIQILSDLNALSKVLQRFGRRNMKAAHRIRSSRILSNESVGSDDEEVDDSVVLASAVLVLEGLCRLVRATTVRIYL